MSYIISIRNNRAGGCTPVAQREDYESALELARKYAAAYAEDYVEQNENTGDHVTFFLPGSKSTDNPAIVTLWRLNPDNTWFSEDDLIAFARSHGKDWRPKA